MKYDYVSIREALGIIGDSLPVIDVDLRPGREPERKKGLVDGIAEVLNETRKCRQKIFTVFFEKPAPDHYQEVNPCQSGASRQIINNFFFVFDWLPFLVLVH